MPFKTKLESPHVIKADQVFIGIIKKGVNESEFNFSFQNKDNQAMLDDLGLTIAKIAKHVPGGLLIFYPSYALMNSIYERWSDAGILQLIQEHKMVYREPKKATEYQAVMERYYTAIF